MRLFDDPRASDDLGAVPLPENPLIDLESLRLLAAWIARRDGLDPALGATVERGFVVLHAHA